MWFIIVQHEDNLRVMPDVFASYGEAERHMKKMGKMDGPEYAIAHSYHWHKLTSNPSWEATVA